MRCLVVLTAIMFLGCKEQPFGSETIRDPSVPDPIVGDPAIGTGGTAKDQGDPLGIISVDTVKNANGSYSAGVVVTRKALRIAISDNTSLAGSTLTINPDTLPSAADISIVEGQPLGTEQNSKALGKSANMVGAGPTVVIASSSFQDPKVAMPMQIALFQEAALALGDTGKDSLGIVYLSVQYGEKFKIVLGIIPSTEVTIQGKTVKFNAPSFGAYQPVFLSADINKATKIEISRDILSKAGETVIVEGGDKTPPTPGNKGILEVTAVTDKSAILNFTLGSDNFTKDFNLAYLAYLAKTDTPLATIDQVEAAAPVGDYRRKISSVTLTDLNHSTTYYVNLMVRDEMSNKAIYQRATFKTTTPNFSPVIQSRTPTLSSVTTSYRDSVNFQVTATDLNASDTLTYTWQLNGAANPNLIVSGASATFVPSMDFFGQNRVRVEVSDGINVTQQTWDVLVHLFRKECMGLAPGNVCTLLGVPDVGSGRPHKYNGESILIRPNRMIDDGSGNWFVSDSDSYVVWFYNRSNAPVTRLGQTIGAGVVQILAGTGVAGSSINNVPARDYPLNNPTGLAYDAVTGALFVANASGNNVVRFGADGIGLVIFGNGGYSNSTSGNTDGGLGTSHSCQWPDDLLYRASTNELFISCGNFGAIKRVTNATAATVSTIKGYTVVGNIVSGVIQTGDVTGTIGAAGVAKIKNPRGMASDASGNLYFADSGNCRVKVVNFGESNLSFFNGGVVVPPGELGNLMGTGICGSMALGSYSSLAIDLPWDVAIKSDGAGGVAGFAVVSNMRNSIMYINNQVNSVTMGNVTVQPYQGALIMGASMAYGYNSDGLAGASTRLAYPTGADFLGNQLLVADSSNRRIRSLKIDVADGAVATELGSGKGTRGFSGDASRPADQQLIASPRGLAAIGRKLFVSDASNYRIRSVDLSHGLTKPAVAMGGGDGGEGPAETTLITTVYDLEAVGGLLYFADSSSFSSTPNLTCKIRTYNPGLASVTKFFVTTPPAWTMDIAGEFSSGCVSWASAGGPFDGSIAKDVSIRSPQSVVVSGDQMYIASYGDHCLLKVEQDGRISRFLGLCGTSGYADGTLDSGLVRLYSPRAMANDPRYPGNLFFSDYSLASGSYRLRYVNTRSTAVSVLGVSVAAASVQPVISGLKNSVSDVAIRDNQFCYAVASGGGVSANSGYSYVECLDLSAASATRTLLVGQGVAPGVPKAGRPFDLSEENVPAGQVRLGDPAYLAFDEDGNLYISESWSSLVRKVARWWK